MIKKRIEDKSFHELISESIEPDLYNQIMKKSGNKLFVHVFNIQEELWQIHRQICESIYNTGFDRTCDRQLFDEKH